MKNYEYVLKVNKTFERINLDKYSNLSNDEITVEPVFVGVCGSDLYHYLSYKGEQLRLGHEWIGKVTAKGKSVLNLDIGDWISTSATIGCGECEYCLKEKVNHCTNAIHLGSDKLGSLRGEITFKSFNALKLKSGDKSEVLIEVMAVAEEALKLMRENTSGTARNALVLGAGTVGILIAQLLKLENINTTIVDIKMNRVSRAEKLGSRSLSLNQLIMNENELHSFDVVFDATSDRDGKPGGWNYLSLFGCKNFVAVMIGKYINKIEITPDQFSRQAAKLVFMRGVPLDMLKFTIEKWSGKLSDLSDQIITHTYSSTNLDNAFAMALDTSNSGKVVIEME